MVKSHKLHHEKDDYIANTQHESLIKIIKTTPNTLRNLSLIVSCWLASNQSFTLFIFYIKYIPVSNVFLVGTAMGFACIGFLIMNYIIRRIGVMKAMKLSYFMVSVLITMVIATGSEANIMVYALLFFLLKMCVCMGYLTIFNAHLVLFDPRILATSYGICGIFTSSTAMLIPIYAELNNRQIPLIIILTLNVIATIACFFMRTIR